MATTPKTLSNLQSIRLAWDIFGGLKGVVRSKDFWCSVLLTVACLHLWTTDRWYDTALSVLPNLLGFTLGGFAIFLGFGSDGFREMIAGEDERESPYMSVSAAFVVFILVQLVATLYALLCKALDFPAPATLQALAPYLHAAQPAAFGVGFLLFVYSLMLTLRAAMRIFRLSRWFNYWTVLQADGRAAIEEEGESRREA